MPQHTLTILGVPAPQGSKTAVQRGGRAILIEGSSTTGRQAHRAWREAVAWQAKAHVLEHGHFGDGPAAVTVTFHMPKPKSKPKKARWISVKPDLDKLARSTLDGLADGGLLAHGDSRVAVLNVCKVYARPGEPTGARVTVCELDDARVDVPTLGE